MKSSENNFETPKKVPFILDKTREHLFHQLGAKKLEIRELFSFGKGRIVARKGKGGTLLDLLTYILLQNIKKLEGDPLRTFKIFKKSRLVPKKLKWEPFSLVRFCRQCRKTQNTS